MRKVLSKFVLTSRWLAAIFLVGLTVALGLFALRYVTKLWKFATTIFSGPEEQALLDLLHLLDWTLVASLVVMIILASWDSLVGQFDDESRAEAGGMAWIRKLDPGHLKVKLAGSIVAISSIQLLQMFLRAETYDDRTIIWALALHGMFLAGVVLLALTDRIGAVAKPPDSAGGP